MLFRKHFFSRRKILALSVFVVYLVVCVGAAFAVTNNGVAPVLMPYNVNSIAGNPWPVSAATPSAGFSGEGGPALWPAPGVPGGSLASPLAIAVDSVGNVYIADTSNAVIREVNALTGNITSVAGVIPTGCAGTSCSTHTSGCADGVPALNNPIGAKIEGIAVDSYGNIYFDDNTSSTVSVVYRGGANVAAFISLENPGAAPTPSAVKSGYVYHVGGTINLATCAGTVGQVDNALAFQGAQMHGPQHLGLDAAGNIYILDISNDSVRVINTQPVTQTFYQYQVQPGFMKAIVNCNGALTANCATIISTTNPGFSSNVNNGGFAPANSVYFGPGGSLQSVGVDGYGNVFETAGSGQTPAIYGGLAYTGGAPMASLINLTSSDYPGGAVTAQYGGFYDVLNNISLATSGTTNYTAVVGLQNEGIDIRPHAANFGVNGEILYQDSNKQSIFRIDPWTQVAVELIDARRNPNGIGSSPATPTNPVYCVYGTTSIGGAFTQGPIETDPFGDGCPAILGWINGSGGGYVVADGKGDIIYADTSNNLIRDLFVGNAFPATPVGGKVTQGIQVHFNAKNNPVIGAAVTSPNPSYVTNAFSIPAGISDFTIDTTDKEFPMGSLGGSSENNTPTTINFALVAGLPTCSYLGSDFDSTQTGDTTLDCLVYVTFSPTAPGLRQTSLTVTTANGSQYSFPLTGIGNGSQLANDGGQQSVLAVNSTTPLGTPGEIAVDQAGSVYIADPANNRVLVQPTSGPGMASGPAITLGTGLSGPMGVAVDAAGNVYIADTGNNRVLEVNQFTGVQTVLGANIWVPGPPSPTASGVGEVGGVAPQYSFKAPRGVAVDTNGNVYVADTGNAVVVEIPSNHNLGGATPLLAYPGAPAFTTPVAVSIDSVGNIYVADTANLSQQIVKLPPGGGDLVTVPGSTLPGLGAAGYGGTNITTPNGVAVDGAGNVYVSDSGAGVVWNAPAAGPPNGLPFTMSFTGLSSPGAVALDPNANLYVADNGNKRIVFMNRQNPVLAFGSVPQAQTNPPSLPLTITNVGNKPATLISPFTSVTSTSPSGNTAFTITNSNCNAGPLPSGTTCTISATFNPTTDGPQGENFTINGGPQSVAITANMSSGEQPLVNIALSAAYSTGTVPAAGSTATVTATVTQPHIPGVIPTGTMTFIYTVDGAATSACGTGGTQTVALIPGTGGASTASFNLPVLAQGRQYSITATYNSDALNSQTTSSPLAIYVPGVSVTATAASTTFAYGMALPGITGTVTGLVPSDNVTYKFTTAASQYSNVGTYPISVVFSGGNFCNYGNPAVTNSGPGGGPAVVTETQASLTVTTPAYTTIFGAADINYASQLVISGAVGTDNKRISATFTPASSSILNVGTYAVVPTLTGKPIGNYSVKITNSTLTVTSAPTGVAVIATATSVPDTVAGIATAKYSIGVSTVVPAGKGTPTGTVTVSDTFIPITPTSFVPVGLIPPAAPGTIPPCSGTVTTGCNTPVVLTLAAGQAVFSPTSTTQGTHYYQFSYSGDSNFQAGVSTGYNNLTVDDPDFTVNSITGVVAIIPGVTPSGDGLPVAPGQSTAAPETAAITIAGVLSFSGQVNLTCQPQNPSYVTCSMTPPTVTVGPSGTTATQTSVFAVSTPAQLPLGFFNTGQVRTASAKMILASIFPVGALAFLARRRRRLSRALWMLLAIAVLNAAMSGCGSSTVNFYTAVPTGPQVVKVTATGTDPTTGTTVTRSFNVPISIN